MPNSTFINPQTIINPMGGAWLVQYFDLSLAYPLYVVSRLGSRRESHQNGSSSEEVYQQSQYDKALLEQITFHLRFHISHEFLHYELLAKVFSLIEPSLLEHWLADEPTGQYARRCGFLYEWFTGNELALSMRDGKSRIAGNYVDAIDADKLVACSPEYVVKNSRWRINDNLAGRRQFCPMIVKTEALQPAFSLDIAQMMQQLTDTFGEDVLMRSSVWITLRESKASFTIEGEGKQTKRIERFAQVMANQLGRGDIPLDNQSLTELQQAILGDSVAIHQFGLRQSPVFVGQVSQRDFKPIVHYIAPPFEQVAQMLAGLKRFIEVTQGQSAVMRCAVVAFAFVYIHPLADGNGRIHRFLMNDMLRRDGLVSEPMILPISQVISETAKDRRAYDQILDSVSMPLMAHMADKYEFGEMVSYADGIRSNLTLKNSHTAQPIWQYLDLTPHIGYMADILRRVIEEDLTEQSRYLRNHDKARVAIKDIIEMPNDYVDTIIRSVLDNLDSDKPSQKLVKAMPFLADGAVWGEIRSAIVYYLT
ncbi:MULTISPECIES: Fic family protein [unclassified Acinetobacter]|uniref:Fic family protein n=1 Tax=unclassified Acinetobacter TaxID=196816 RepID=UPI0035B7EADD